MRKYIIPYKIGSKDYSSTNKKLADFIDEVEKVIYLENEILFPHAVEAEKSLQNI
jgi:iron-sulfur cluster repair protein YtfE (RIC family)